MPAIEFQIHWTKTKNSNAILRDTAAEIEIIVDNKYVANRVRGLAMSLAVSALWIGSFLLVYTFKYINVAMGATGTFWLYGIICLVSGIAIWKLVPETNGRSLEEIERELCTKES